MRIHKLSDETIMKIAAGEVITGTYAVVKELIENSIDSNATAINVEIIDGGKSLIKVIDNGIGMNEEEIKYAVQPHTTSKINKIDDLYNLETYGFRGEALSSICRVSRMKITSRTNNEELATMISFIGGKEVNKKKVSASVGTQIEIEDLFFNIPARRKFLKSSSAEGRMVTEIIEKFILSSDTSIVYKRENKEIYNISKDYTLKEKFKILFPELKDNDLIILNKNYNWLKINGIISNPKITRFNRSAQIFFVNGRYVKSGDLFSVFERAYGEMLETRRHPYGVLFIDVNPREVDVNVHPQKLEVKFSDASKLLKLLKTSIREELDNQTEFKLEFYEDNEVKEDIKNTKDSNELEDYRFYENKIKENVEQKETTYNNFLNNDFSIEDSNKKYFNQEKSTFKYNTEQKKLNWENLNESPKSTLKNISKNQIFISNTKDVDDYRIVGIIFKRYIILEFKNKIKLIDFHAAHERVIFEKLKKQFFDKKINTKLLLNPIKIKLDELRKETLKNNIENLKKLGIEIEKKEDVFYIKGVPAEFKIENIENTVFELLDNFRLEGIENMNKIYDNAIATMSCRAAVKTGDNIVGIETLIQNLMDMKLLTCPHGRPIAMDIDLNKLDTYFERK
ncbi:DNA mismatch repair protein MutL [Tepiditoga spiralis]|uniref:DNA mismatch repair protein MutL n=1 Tax=Tepiditoga spiralis TaxID=2108365 RepID=A0A7G1G672_9BACT|nr:DNA mismatch repair endonuclease MutL [Tepiditoga spiralis]BBE32100.1 DNA mismatch repair protein MutL [Tepiditoga spiralis]